ncbi:MAG: DUF4479 domain-containing protein [Bacilli bacterium]|jgi:tRNA-binding protein|nr:DUF4479 domain-containing protein [Bacilli bacterium]
MKYKAFYVDKCIMIYLKNINCTSHEMKGNICILYHDQKIIGYNIFDVESPLLIKGLLKQSDELNDLINKELSKQGLASLEVDDTAYFVVGHVVECRPHPQSAKLHITQVDIKDEIIQIVCGAKNIALHQKVVVAKVGAVLNNGTWILPGKIMNEKSNGMICSDKELGLSEVSHGILVLDDTYHIGDAFIV